MRYQAYICLSWNYCYEFEAESEEEARKKTWGVAESDEIFYPGFKVDVSIDDVDFERIDD